MCKGKAHEYEVIVKWSLSEAYYVYSKWGEAVYHLRMYTHKWPIKLNKVYKSGKWARIKITRRCMDKE